MMKKILAVVSIILVSTLCVVAHADVFNLGKGLTNLDTVAVGDPGNQGDTRYGSAFQKGLPDSFGAVAYSYNIGKYDVTTAQYVDFLNNKAKTSDPYKLYTHKMMSKLGCQIKRTGKPGDFNYSVDSAWANRPVNFVSYWSACRFANWLNNGQGNGDTETGAYSLNGTMQETGNIKRNPGWKWSMPSEDEWYKAAYYDPKKNDGKGLYWDFATRNDTCPGNQLISPDPGNEANWNNSGYTIGAPYYRTNVGEFANSASPWGTYDQAGNVWNWNEGDMYVPGLRGGSCGNDKPIFMIASNRSMYFGPTTTSDVIGFRVVASITTTATKDQTTQ